MTQTLQIHPQNPQERLLRQAVEVLNRSGVIVYPTDSAYALGCQIGDKDAAEEIRKIRHLDKNHNFTLVCRDLSEIATYASVDNVTFRFLKAHTPGPYTFILPATKDVPKRLQHPKRKTIGVRVPDNLIAQMLLKELGAPLMSVTLILSDDGTPVTNLDEIQDRFKNQIDLILDGGFCGVEPTTVIDFLSGAPEVVRIGKGKILL